MQYTKEQRVIRVIHHQRRPRPSNRSIERLFATIRAHFSAEVECKVSFAPHFSNGILNRIRNGMHACRQRADVHHVTGDISYIAIFLFLFRRRIVLTVHDCAVVERASGLRRIILKQLWFRIPCRLSTCVIVISPSTREILAELTGIDRRSIRVIPNCVTAVADAPNIERDEDSLLQLGCGPNKNISRLADAASNTGYSLRITGQLTPEQKSTLAKSGVKWTELGMIEDDQLSIELARAAALTFFSTSEGFGLPILEAQQAGTIVLTSNIDPMKWVAGSGAIFADPFSTASIISALEELRHLGPLRSALLKSARVNCGRFNPEHCAALYESAYRSTIPKTPEASGS